MTLIWISLGCAAILLVVTVLPYSRRKEWWIRAWEFPRLQLATLCLVLFALSVFLVRTGEPVTWLAPATAMACFCWHTYRIYPFTPLRRVEVPHVAPSGPDNRLQLLVSNVLMDNRETGRLIDLVKREDPTVLLTLESNAFWGERLAVLKSRYPHCIEQPLENTFGMHFYSKLPICKSDIRFMVEDDVPSFEIDLEMKSGATVRLYCVHPAPPSPTENETSRERDAELVMIGRRAAECPHPVITAGDLNDVAWSRTTRQFRRISGLLDPRVGRGFFNTFHARIPLIRWPLDHIFHSPHFRVVKLRRLPAIGSDHFPILIELDLQPDAATL